MEGDASTDPTCGPNAISGRGVFRNRRRSGSLVLPSETEHTLPADRPTVRDYRDMATMLFAGPAQILHPTDEHNDPRPGRIFPTVEAAIDACPDDSAVVAPVRNDVIVLDLDGCGDHIAAMVSKAVTDSGGVIPYMAASGSPESWHIIAAYRTPEATESIKDQLRVWARKFNDTPDSAAKVEFKDRLRLPGSPSFKAGCHAVRPCDSLDEVAAHLKTVGLPLTPLIPATVHDVPVKHHQRPPRRNLTDQERALWQYAQTDIPAGERSDVAARLTSVFAGAGWSDTEALNELLSIDMVNRTWTRPTVLAEWRKACEWWAAKYAEHIAVVDGWELVAGEWRTRAGHQQRLVLAAVCLHRYLDGGGLQNRPLAIRDVVAWTGLSKLAVSRALSLMSDNEDGALELSRHHKEQGPTAASTYSLKSPSREIETRESPSLTSSAGGSREIETRDYLHVLFPSREIGTPEYTPPASQKNANRGVHTFENAIHPLWQTFGTAAPSSCAVYEVVAHDDDVEKTPKWIAEQVGLPVGQCRNNGKVEGTRGILAALHAAGLIREDRGVWSPTGMTLDAAAEARGVAEMLEKRAEKIATERAEWTEQVGSSDSTAASA